MSLCSVEKTIERIKQTEPEEPVAVFKRGDCFDVVYSSTYKTQQLIKAGDAGYIGEFSKISNIVSVVDKLSKAV